MKVFIQIPCFNEEATLRLVLEGIPKKIDGVDELAILVIDDGSTDKTLEVARDNGVKHFVRHTRNMGLARSFHDGINYALSHGADIVVNTDGDNQYPQRRIADLIKPILDGQADIVIGDRQTQKIAHFSPLKKALQRFGSWVVNKAADTELPDAASGFRAYSKRALTEINIITDFSYTMETIIHAGRKGISITSVAITTNPKTRDSRLFKNNWQHVKHSAAAILRSYTMHKPFKVFSITSAAFLILGFVPFLRYAYLFLINNEAISAHLQSLILGSVLIIVGVLFAVLGILADLIKINRRLLEDILERLKSSKFTDDEK